MNRILGSDCQKMEMNNALRWILDCHISLGEQGYTKAEFHKISLRKLIMYIPSSDANSGKVI